MSEKNKWPNQKDLNRHLSKENMEANKYIKINSKWVKNLNVQPETIQLLEENIGKTVFDINHSRILYVPPPRILEIKAKRKQIGLIKIESFCTTKETISKVKRHGRK